MILDEHFAMIVNPQFPNDDVMHSSRDLFVGVMVASILELHMSVASRTYREILASETRSHLNHKIK
jgi:hypothetical protein